MAPLKRTLDAYLFAEDTLGAFDSSPVEILMVDPVDDNLFAPSAKKLKTATATPAEAVAATKDLAGYLDFGDYQPGSPEAIVPSAKDLVSGTDDWLGSRPGSPSHVSFHELPGEDDWLSSGPSSPSSDLDFEQSTPSAAFFDDNDVFNPVFGAGDVMDRAAAGMLETSPDAVRTQSVSPPATPSAADTVPTVPVAPVATANTPASTTTVSSTTVASKPVAPTASKATKATKSKQAPKSSAGKSKSKSVSSSSTTAPEQKADANRWAHNSTERKRRCEIRRLFSDLRDLFPDLQGDERVSNINTLSRAIQCVAELDREAMEQAMALHTLRERNAALKAAAAARNGGVLPSKFASQPVPKSKAYRAVEATKTVISDTYPQKIQTAPVTSISETTPADKDLMARAAADPSLRRTLPLALRELMDHNSRGAYEVKPLPPRRPKLVRAE